MWLSRIAVFRPVFTTMVVVVLMVLGVIGLTRLPVNLFPEVSLPVITAVVLGGVNIFGGSGTLPGVLVALLVLAFVQNALGLAGVTPEEQQIVTGAVLVLTLIVFGGSGFVRKARAALKLRPRRS